MSDSPRLYDYPELYEKLFPPSDSQVELLDKYLDKYFPDGVNTLLEPACGAGFWIDHINANFSYGVDKSESMIKFCTEKYANSQCVAITLGDMSNLPSNVPKDIELAVSPEATVGHLDNGEALLRHLESVRSRLSPGGLYFFGCPLKNEMITNDLSSARWETSNVKLSKGEASLIVWYETSSENSAELIDTKYEINIVNNDEYPVIINGDLHINRFDCNEVSRYLEKAGFEILSVNYMELPDYPESPNLYNFGTVSIVAKNAF